VTDHKPSVEEVATFMRDRSLMLVTAESCTGGLIAATLADIPGAGQLLDCAFVTYSPEAKKRCLSVKAETMERCNLTSEEVAREMALGAFKNSQANVAVSNTGVVDDTDRAIPAGTQCFAWVFKSDASQTSARQALFSETRRFAGNRTEIRIAAARYALERIPHYFLIHSKSPADPRSG